MPSISTKDIAIDLGASLQNQHRNRLDSMQEALEKLIKVHKSPVDANTSASVSKLVKKIVHYACSVPDNFFLSDSCGLVHEIFASFRILLGKFEEGKRFDDCFEDVVNDCEGLVHLYRSFLRDPGYNGTAFPKPDAIKAMRRMSQVMAVDPAEMKAKRNSTVNANIHANYMNTKPARNIKTPLPTSATIVQMDSTISAMESVSVSPSNSSCSIGSERNLLRAFEPPATPQLGPVPLTNSVLEAVKQLMPVSVPQQQHPKAETQSKQSQPKTALDEINRHLLHPHQTTLRPPMFVDDEGDLLPQTPPPQVSPVVSDDDSFVQAYRKYSEKQKERRASAEASLGTGFVFNSSSNSTPQASSGNNKRRTSDYNNFTSGWAK